LKIGLGKGTKPVVIRQMAIIARSWSEMKDGKEKKTEGSG